MGERWGDEGPPPDGYSRVTNAERFRPLHAEALRVLEELQGTFNVERTEGSALDSELQAGQQLSRSTIRLAPASPDAAPIVVAFTSLPGIVVRCGRWFVERFPACGCDACAETSAGEIERLRNLVANVSAGRFRERISLPLVGAAWYEYELGSNWHSRGRSRLTRSRAKEMIGDRSRRVEWTAWS